MDIDLRTLSISRDEVYVHPVPLPPKSQKCATAPCTMDKPTGDRIESELRLSLSKQRIRLEFLPDSHIQPLISSIIHHKATDFDRVSQDLAKHLYQIQTGNVSPGMLIVAKARCNNGDAIALLKLDHELRVKDEERTLPSGVTYDLSEISTLGIDKRRVFKAALFVESSNGTGLTEIIASDHQVDGRDGRSVADFFMVKFLGCQQSISAANTLKSFYSAIVDISNEIQKDDEKLDFITAITTELESADPSVDVEEFVSDHVPEDVQPKAREILLNHNINAAEILKTDTSEVERMKYVSLDLSNGLRIIGPLDHIHSLLETDNVDGTSTITIEAEIVRTGLRKRK